MLGDPCGELLGLCHGLGIDRHERFGRTHLDHVGPESSKRLRKDLSRDTGVLVKDDLQSLEATGGEERDEPLDVVPPCCGILRAEFTPLLRLQVSPVREIRGAVPDARGFFSFQVPVTAGNLCFVRLQDLTPGHVVLDAVAILRYVASGDHDARHLVLQALDRHGRRWNQATVVDLESFLMGCEGDGLEDARCALPAVPGDGDRSRRGLGPHVPKKGEGVQIALAVRHVGHEPPHSAGPEFKRHSSYPRRHSRPRLRIAGAGSGGNPLASPCCIPHCWPLMPSPRPFGRGRASGSGA